MYNILNGCRSVIGLFVTVNEPNCWLPLSKRFNSLHSVHFTPLIHKIVCLAVFPVFVFACIFHFYTSVSQSLRDPSVFHPEHITFVQWIIDTHSHTQQLFKCKHILSKSFKGYSHLNSHLTLCGTHLFIYIFASICKVKFFNLLVLYERGLLQFQILYSNFSLLSQ